MYCPITEKLVHLHDPALHKYGHYLEEYENLEFLGATISDSQAIRIAKAEVHATGKRWSAIRHGKEKHEEEDKKEEKKDHPAFKTYSIQQYEYTEKPHQSPERF